VTPADFETLQLGMDMTQRPLRIHWLQHVAFEGLGSIEPWAVARGHALDRTRLFAGEPLPIPADFDWLIVMGGPMGVGDEGRFPWLTAEKRFLRETLAAGKTVLGICLGAQLLAEALGAGVHRNVHREVGWFPVRLGAVAETHPALGGWPAEVEVFHWHGDTFTVPPGAVALAGSAACANQAFAFGERVLALQFHLETTPAAARALIENCSGDLAAGPFVQDAATLLAPAERFDCINALMRRTLEALETATMKAD
jgi:GMP synthase-like glutamine amidotransferase